MASAKRHHPFYQAPAGAVFAVTIAPEKWGYVRFFRGRAVGILSVASPSPILPKINWMNPPIGWVFFSFAPDSDNTEVISLGIVPFENEAAEWPPPCFDPPDVIQNYYRIHERGAFRKWATENDVRGMQQCRTVTPAELSAFLLAQLKAGGLTPN